MIRLWGSLSGPSAQDLLGGVFLADDAIYGYARLQDAVDSLLESHERLRQENGELEAALEARAGQLGKLEAALDEHQRRRSDSQERIDALVLALEELDERLERAEETRSVEAAAPVGGTAP